MKNQLFIKKAALSALLMAAVISPVAAYAADGSGTTAAPQQGQTALTAVKAPGAFNFISVDPIQLAKEYAPETVEDWTTVLKKLEEAGKPVLRFTLASAAELKADAEGTATLTAVPSVDLSKMDLKELHEGALTAVGAINLQDLTGIKSATPAKPVDIKGETVTLTAVRDVNLTMDLKALPEGAATVVGVVDPSLIPDKVAATAAKPADSGAVTLPGEDANLPLLQANADLVKAVGAKDASAIKASLSKLLDLYKDQLNG